MPIAAPLIFVAALMTVLIGSIMFYAQRNRHIRHEAEKLIADAASRAAHSARSGVVVFRKSRLLGLLFFLLFLIISSAALFWLRFDPGVNSAGLPYTKSAAGIVILISLLPLGAAIWQFKYTLRLSDDELSISTFATRSVSMQNISEVTIGTFKASSSCHIRVNTGEEDLNVGSDLKGFLDFVKLLSENVAKAQTN